MDATKAALAEAAPDLLAAAVLAERLLARQRWVADGTSTDPEAVALVALRQAIAKATGGQP